MSSVASAIIGFLIFFTGLVTILISNKSEKPEGKIAGTVLILLGFIIMICGMFS